ncbi:MAG: hypothetical protein ACEY3L_01280 [Wolbachia sp.]
MNVRTAMDLFSVSHPLTKRDDDCQASAPMMSSQCPDTGIQKSLLVSKQTSIESGYNVFDEIIWKTRFQRHALE